LHWAGPQGKLEFPLTISEVGELPIWEPGHPLPPVGLRVDDLRGRPIDSLRRGRRVGPEQPGGWQVWLRAQPIQVLEEVIGHCKFDGAREQFRAARRAESAAANQRRTLSAGAATGGEPPIEELKREPLSDLTVRQLELLLDTLIRDVATEEPDRLQHRVAQTLDVSRAALYRAMRNKGLSWQALKKLALTQVH
jgi:hypothetical protein